MIGAGAAGLAAARELSGAGRRVAVIEARDRIGGRIFTLHQPDLALPIELGAEFIHGEAAETFDIVDAAALLAYELPDDHWWVRGGKWQRVANFWEVMDDVFSRIRGGRDRSFADFLRAQRSLPPRVKQMALQFVEGFNAARTATPASTVAAHTASWRSRWRERCFSPARPPATRRARSRAPSRAAAAPPGGFCGRYRNRWPRPLPNPNPGLNML